MKHVTYCLEWNYTNLIRYRYHPHLHYKLRKWSSEGMIKARLIKTKSSSQVCSYVMLRSFQSLMRCLINKFLCYSFYTVSLLLFGTLVCSFYLRIFITIFKKRLHNKDVLKPHHPHRFSMKWFFSLTYWGQNNHVDLVY